MEDNDHNWQELICCRNTMQNTNLWQTECTAWPVEQWAVQADTLPSLGTPRTSHACAAWILAENAGKFTQKRRHILSILSRCTHFGACSISSLSKLAYVHFNSRKTGESIEAEGIRRLAYHGVLPSAQLSWRTVARQVWFVLWDGPHRTAWELQAI
jgi:hypothetical protein